jgi:predicted metal-dependent hydrolase
LSTPPADDPTFAAAVALFNDGRYLACHELFEELWESTEGPDSDYYKGLLQAAMALHHLQKGNLAGAAKHYAGHRRYLARYVPAHRGVDVEALLRALGRALAPALVNGANAAFSLEERPLIRAPRGEG